MQNKKRTGIRFFVLSFLTTFSLITAAGFLLLMRIIDPAPVQKITENLPKIEHTFTDSDSITILTIGYSRKDTQTAFYSLIRLDAPNQRVIVTSIPADTEISDKEGQKTLLEIATYGGSPALVQKLSSALDVTIDRWLRIEETSFANLVDEFGAVTYDCPQKVEYYDQNGFLAYSMSEGKHVLFGEKLCGLIRYSGTNAIERANEHSNIIVSLFSQRLKSGRYDDFQTAFELLMASCETSINAFDLENRRAAFEQMTTDKTLNFVSLPFSKDLDEYNNSLSAYR